MICSQLSITVTEIKLKIGFDEIEMKFEGEDLSRYIVEIDSTYQSNNLPEFQQASQRAQIQVTIIL